MESAATAATSPSTASQQDDYSSDDEVLEKSQRDDSLRSSAKHQTMVLPPPSFSGNFLKRRKKGDISGTSSSSSLSYAEALRGGQNFFQRARVESISLKHGFPPSKDPYGTKSVAMLLQKAKEIDEKMMVPRIFHDHPIQGIVPTGWLEKHVHALPSVLVIVGTVTSSQKVQDEQDRILFEVIDNMESGLAVKRECVVHVVGLVHDDVVPTQAFAWSDAIYHKLAEYQQITPKRSTDRVTLVRISTDLETSTSGFTTSEALHLLHESIRMHSLNYYSQLTRRNKKKFAALFPFHGRVEQGIPSEILPLAVRYAFKIAIYYEFQWRHELSIKWMSEGYRLLVKYFGFLQTEEMEEENPTARSLIDAEGGVELSVDSDTKLYKFLREAVPNDMIHQCRGVAEWFNLKLLLMGFGSHTEYGLIAASNQWRHHNRFFCSLGDMDSWRDWSYVARQRLVISQLVERHPPTALGKMGFEFDEILIRCSPWRCYESAAEALLRVAALLNRAKDSASCDENPERNKSLRPPFVGSLDSDGFDASLRDEVLKDHRKIALDVVSRGIQLFENEMIREKRGFHAEDDFMERSASRMGARLYYIAGGILLGMDRYEEAITHLEEAAKFCHQWYELQLAVRRLMIVCFRNGARPTNKRSKGNETLASMILDSYFNAEMSPDDLRTALTHFVSSTGEESLKWYHEAKADDDDNLPFSFRVSFPKCLFSTVGDSAEANVSLKSNLDYAIYIKSVALKSLAGTLLIPKMDLLRAKNALEGSEGQGIIVPKKGEIEITTLLHLPKNLEGIAVDESGNGGEILATAGKGSFAKSARPRSAGITAAGGARFLSEDSISRGDGQSQGWDLRFLGGKPLRCDGINVEFYPLQAERVAGVSDSITPIELTIERQKEKTHANIKRTPFEEENYIASAWSASLGDTMPPGPRSLRVLIPRAGLSVQNLTDPLTDGHALEGTINRVLLKLVAGSKEKCHDIKIKIAIFSVFVTQEGKTVRIVHDKTSQGSVEDCVFSDDPIVRAPVLLRQSSDEDSTPVSSEVLGGWSLCEDGTEFTMDSQISLDKGESLYVPIHLYRRATYRRGDRIHGDKVFDFDPIDCLCRTDYYVNITYRQERASKPKKKPQRVGRQRPRMSSKRAVSDATMDSEVELELPHLSNNDTDSKDPDIVTTEYSGNVIWSHPVFCEFAEGAGNRSLLNEVDPDENGNINSTKIRITKESAVPITCKVSTMHLHPSLENTVDSIELDVSTDPHVHLCSSNSVDEGPWVLSSATSFVRTAYTIKVRDSYTPRAATLTSIGHLDVLWTPSSLRHDPDFTASTALVGLDRGDILHGPLSPKKPIRLSFDGPECMIESEYFEIHVDSTVDVPRVGEPFSVRVHLVNQTAASQRCILKLVNKYDLLLNGPTRSTQSFSPFEKKMLQFTAVAPHVGCVRLPKFDVEGPRWTYKNTSDTPDHALYIFPA